MASTYSPNLKIELIATGEQANTWGDTTNNNFEYALEEAIVGYGTVSFTTDGTETISISNSNTSQEARKIFLEVTSDVDLTATRNLIVPTIEKTYIIYNNTTGDPDPQSILVKTTGGSGVTVPNGKKMLLYVDGVSVIQQANYFDSIEIKSASLTGTPTAPNATSGTNTTQVATTAFVNTEIAADTGSAPSSFVVSNSTGAINTGTTFTCTSATPAVLTFSAGYTPTNNDRIYLYSTETLPAGLSLNTLYYVVNAAGQTCQVSLTEGGGGVPTSNTGTGTHSARLQRVIPSGTIVGTSDTQTLTNKTLTSPTINGGTITGITDLAVADGGTGTSTLTAESILIGDGTNAVKFVAPGTNGNVLKSNGTVWASTAPLTLGTALTTPAGSTLEFTGVPAWVKRITIVFDSLSQNASVGGSDFRVQLGTSSGYGNPGTSPVYSSNAFDNGGNTGNITNGFVITSTATNGDVCSGTMVLCNVSGNKWVSSHAAQVGSNSKSSVGGGRVELSGTLDRLRVNTMTANTFDAGSVNVIYE